MLHYGAKNFVDTGGMAGAVLLEPSKYIPIEADTDVLASSIGLNRFCPLLFGQFWRVDEINLGIGHVTTLTQLRFLLLA